MRYVPALIALAIIVAGALVGFAIYTFGWHNASSQHGVLAPKPGSHGLYAKRVFKLRQGDAVEVPGTQTRCVASGEGGVPNLFCTHSLRTRFQVELNQYGVGVFDLARHGEPMAPTYFVPGEINPGGSGQVAASGRIGLLRIDEATVADIRRFGGTPDFKVTGKPSIDFPHYRALGYACSSGGTGLDPGAARPTHLHCRTVYFLNAKNGTLVGFWTNSRTFRTVNGARVGMPQARVDRVEKAHAHVHALTGIDVQSPAAALFIENVGCKPGANLEQSPCVGGRVHAFILESRRHPVGLLEDAIPNA